MPVQGLDPQHAVEVIGTQHGSGYRIGGRLVLTARHLVAHVAGATCTVRARHAFGEVSGQVVWQAPHADVALVALPETVPTCEPVRFGRLPEPGHSAMTLPFECYGWPQWAQTTPPGQPAKAGGRHLQGTIHLADTSSEGFLIVAPTCMPDRWELQKQDSASITASATPAPTSPAQHVSHYDFFIAYATPDRRRAQELCWFLQDEACTAFLDVQDLSPGAVWPPALREALEASRAILVLVSTHTDDAVYQQEEIVRAIALARHEPHAHTVIPVLLDTLPQGTGRLPYGMSSRLAQDATRAGGLERVARGLATRRQAHQRQMTRPPMADAMSQAQDALETEPQAQHVPWQGVSGAAVLCHGLIVAVQHQPQNPRRTALLEAEPLDKVYDDAGWRQCLAAHGVPCDPVAFLDELPKRREVYRDRVIQAITAKLEALKDSAPLEEIADEIQQLAGDNALGDAIRVKDLASRLAACMVQHRAVTDVVGCLIHLMHGLASDHATTIADVIDLLLPFNYAPDVLWHLQAQLAAEQFGLVEQTVTLPALAEIIMAGHDRQAAQFVAQSDARADLRGVTALTYHWAPTEGPEDADAEALGVSRAVRDFLYDLRALFEQMPPQSPRPQGAQELQREIEDHASRVRGRLRARSKIHRRTMYCVLQLPEGAPQRTFRTQILREIARLLNPEDTVLVFVELMAYQRDDREDEVAEFLGYLHTTLHTRYVRPF